MRTMSFRVEVNTRHCKTRGASILLGNCFRLWIFAAFPCRLSMRNAKYVTLFVTLFTIALLLLWHYGVQRFQIIGYAAQSARMLLTGTHFANSDAIPPLTHRLTQQKSEDAEAYYYGAADLPHFESNYSTFGNYSSGICNPLSNENLIIVYVYSAPGHVDRRNKIRGSWGSVKTHNGTDVRVVFFVGAVESAALQKELLSESASFYDIVQDISYTDAYRNLTRKGVSAMYWVATHCPKALRVLKVDDDTLVNPFNVISFVRNSERDILKKFICQVTPPAKPERRPEVKYYVPFEEFRGELYPAYCEGYAYMMPLSAIPRILYGVKNSTFLTVEDVYFTGVLSQFTGMSKHPLSSLQTTICEESTEKLLNQIVLKKELLFIGHVKSLVHYDLFWQLILGQRATVELLKGPAPGRA